MLIRSEVHTSEFPMHYATMQSFRFDLIEALTPVTITLAPVSNYDEETNEDYPSLLIRAEADFAETAALRKLLAATATPEMPEEYASSDPWIPAERILEPLRSYTYSTRGIRHNSKALESDLDKIDSLLSMAMLRFVSLMRWRSQAGGSDEFLRERTLLTQLNNGEWRLLQNLRAPWVIRIHPYAVIDERFRDDIQGMINEDLNPPLAHDLMREALYQRDENPRSALVMAASAAEVGIKRFIAIQIPQIEYLIDELPAPPISKLVRNLLPKLVSEDDRASLETLSPELFYTPIAKAFEHRNSIVHKPDFSEGNIKAAKFLASDQFEKSLNALNDLVYLLDYFEGKEWALENVSSKVRQFFEVVQSD